MHLYLTKVAVKSYI